MTTGFIRFFEKWTPNSMVFAFLLTIVVGILALLFTPTPLLFTSAEGQLSLVDAWAGLLEPADLRHANSLIMITGSVVATAPPVKRALHRLAYVPNSLFPPLC
ncbi:MAG: TIGR00366 family protein [Ruthenibacterium lactatiformans]|uniref:TIGR00366 family protein n=1 Tax=Ruthenibacterium lactatiformans TaxID=1550024 RepID=UPI0039915DB5